MMQSNDDPFHRARIVANVAATVIALASGTNYVYSAWAPQFADRLNLSATESNLIGAAGNLGMYSMGVPIGIVVDAKGPRLVILLGSFLLGSGYLPIKVAFDLGSGSVPLLCFFSWLTGLGGCMAFNSSLKAAALNWPHHRGTATAFPLAAFGLSAFFFSVLGRIFYPGNTSHFLMSLALGTFIMSFGGFFFIRVLPHSGGSYHSVPSLTDSQLLLRTSSDGGRSHFSRRADTSPYEPGTSFNVQDPAETRPLAKTQGLEAPKPAQTASTDPANAEASADIGEEPEIDETSSLISSLSSIPGDVPVQDSVDTDRTHRLDIRGWKLVRNVEFWQLWCIMGILTGIGLMTINNIGHDVNALWKRFDGTVSEEALIAHQQLHVSFLSLGSFAGRLLSGVGSDFLAKRLSASRIWCLVFSAVLFCVAQTFGLTVTDPHKLWFLSTFSGLGYGFLFGVFPSIIAETFGIHGLSQNWGVMTLSPIISGNIFNLFYGTIFDSHSVVEPSGERSCEEGIECYRAAYGVTMAACWLGIGLTLWTIRHQHVARMEEERKENTQE